MDRWQRRPYAKTRGRPAGWVHLRAPGVLSPAEGYAPEWLPQEGAQVYPLARPHVLGWLAAGAVLEHNPDRASAITSLIPRRAGPHSLVPAVIEHDDCGGRSGRLSSLRGS